MTDERTGLIVPKDAATKGDLHREVAASEARMEQRLQNVALEAKVGRLLIWMTAAVAVSSGIVVGAMMALR